MFSSILNQNFSVVVMTVFLKNLMLLMRADLTNWKASMKHVADDELKAKIQLEISATHQ